MTLDEVNALAANGESEQIECKKSTGQRTEAGKTVCAMLNGLGGFVLFGIASDGTVLGQQLGETTVDDLLHEFRRIEPQIPINPEIVRLANGQAVIVVSVPGTSGSIYTFDGRPYFRHGATTLVMGHEEYRRRLLDQMHPLYRWETQLASGFAVEDLDAAQIERTVEEAVRRGRLNEPGTRDIDELVRGLGLVREGVPLNAAAVLFAKSHRLLPGYPQCLLRMARFRGTSTAEFRDNRQVHGNLFELYQSAQSFLRDHLPVAGRIVPWVFEREDDPLYPPEALREALANAFCHKNYALTGGSVSIAIFDDRLEISSSGTLPFGLSVEDLERPHASRPWNPIIAQVLFRCGLIEQWGTGISRMREITMRAGLTAPQLEVRAGEVVVRFFPTSYLAPRLSDRALTTIERQVLETLAKLGLARANEIVEAVGTTLSEAQIVEALQSLRELGFVEVRDHGRDTRWRRLR